MTIVAGIAAGDVGQVLAGCNDTVMTGAANTNDLCVVNGISRCENIGVVAVLTHIAGLNVGDILARRINAVVTVNAVGSDIDVIEVSGQPTCC